MYRSTAIYMFCAMSLKYMSFFSCTLSLSALTKDDLTFFVACSDQNNKRIVLALQSGLKSEILWALNALTVLSFKEKDDFRRDTTSLAKVPGLLDALLQVVCSKSHFLFQFDFSLIIQW
jgi:hypothetical protein